MSRMIQAVFAFLLIVGLTACTSSGDTKGDQSADTQGEVQAANDAYLAALSEQVAAAEWPAGYMPDVDRMYERSTAEDMFIPDPDDYAKGAVGFFRQCAWSMAWLDANASGNTARADAAMRVLQDPALYAAVDEVSREHLLGLASKASLGDATGLNSFIEQNCLPLDWIVES